MPEDKICSCDCCSRRRKISAEAVKRRYYRLKQGIKKCKQYKVRSPPRSAVPVNVNVVKQLESNKLSRK